MEEPRQRGAIAQSVTVETGSAKERNEGVNKIEVAVGTRRSKSSSQSERMSYGKIRVNRMGVI